MNGGYGDVECHACRRPASFIVGELRRQVDHQITAAASIDTKAAGLIAATFALFALVVPRVVLQTVASCSSGSTHSDSSSRRWRISPCRYGPESRRSLTTRSGPAGRILGDPLEEVEAATARAFAGVRNINATAIQTKTRSLVAGIVFLVLTVIGLGAMVLVGGLK
jgi:hypothetical protein